jgi:flotillin
MSGASDIKITGCCWWTTVVVPPNMYVVHTRRGYADPLHLGLGIGFYFNKYTDSFLVAPSTLQTLLINARCICKERQGIMISAYVQYVVEDFAVAYRKLDFSDIDDPMRIVNVQLREQCEASIKDKVATLSIDEVLADKRPIVDELTARLRSVSDGQGLKIVQVQIKEAVVSSSTLWDALQRPFREEQARVARLAELDRERVIRKREIEDRTEAERDNNESKTETEKRRRAQEVELARSKAELEDVRVAAELAQISAQGKLDEAKSHARLEEIQRDLTKASLEHEAALKREYAQLKLEEERKRVENLITPQRLEELLIRSLPSIVERMPKPEHLQSIHLSSDGKAGAADPLLGLAGLIKVAKSLISSTQDKDSLM